jgi:hypothetical protein
LKSKNAMMPGLGRRSQCPTCGKDLRLRRGAGRQKRYCSPHCRRVAKSGREFDRKAQELISGPASTGMAGLSPFASKTSTETAACRGEFGDRPCRFSVPRNVLGGGSFRFPGTPRLDRATREVICFLEIGPRQSLLREPAPPETFPIKKAA